MTSKSSKAETTRTADKAPEQPDNDQAPKTGAEIKQDEINAACETLCNKLEEINPTQARIVRALYRDKLPTAQLRNILKMPEHVISQQRGFAMKALVDIVTGGILRQWATPRSQVPAIGESINKGRNDEANETGGDPAA